MDFLLSQPQESAVSSPDSKTIAELRRGIKVIYKKHTPSDLEDITVCKNQITRSISKSNNEKVALDFIEQSPQLIRREAKLEAALHNRLWPKLPETHKTVIIIQDLLNLILESIGMPRDFVRVQIFSSNIPDAHIQLYERLIRISSGFLETLEGNPQEIMAILGHEIGHIILAHYRLKNTSGMSGECFDPCNDHVKRFEEEYQADRTSNIINNRLGIEPIYLASALRKMEKRLHDLFIKTADHLNCQQTEYLNISILSTHPHINRRIISILKNHKDLPKYPQKIPLAQIPIPERNEFQEPKLNEQVTKYAAYPDCIWEEMDIPITFKLSSETLGNPLKDLHEGSAEPMSFLPDQVNAWTHEDGDISRWWQAAHALANENDGYRDLSDDIDEYSLSATKILLMQVSPEFYSDSLTIEGYEKELIMFSLSNHYRYNNFDYCLMVVTSLLIRNLFNKDPSLKTVTGLRRLFSSLREYSYIHGTYLPYTGARFFIQLENLFNHVSNDNGRRDIGNLCKEYETELTGATDDGEKLAKALMPDLCQWLELNSINLFCTYSSEEQGSKKKLYQLEDAVIEGALSESTTSQEAKNLLKEVPHNFRLRNLTLNICNVIAGEFSKYNSKGLPDFLWEYDPAHSANVMNSDEFEDNFFGSKRNKYEKTKYGTIDNKFPEYGAVVKLWNMAGYKEEFDKFSPGVDKLQFIFETFHACSATRDQLIVEALGWDKLRYVEDITKTQKKVLEIDDPKLIFILLNNFSNPVLNLAISQRLWDLFKQSPEIFQKELPLNEKIRVSRDIEQFQDIFCSQELEAILTCYPYHSYIRDDLLRPLVDAAPNKEQSLAIASLYIEPPPGVIHPRETNMVALSESLFDIIRDMPPLDRQELLLYFLGHDFFYSGIDAQFFPETKTQVEKYRREAIFSNSYLDRKDIYIVKKPDKLVLLTKASGIPFELLFKEQNIALTKREQRDFITNILLGQNGLLTRKDKEQFLGAVARDVVMHSSWSIEKDPKARTTIIELLNFALNHCPEHRISDLFLSFWNLQKDQNTLPQVVATMLRGLGSLFIKAGQYLGTQSNELPQDWIRAFRRLSDQNSQSEKSILYEHEYATFGENSPLESIGKKLGEGSMASVHEGFLKTGSQKVAVKSFHQSTEVTLDQDGQFLTRLVNFINGKKDIFNIHLPNNLAEVCIQQIRKELSFEQGLANYTIMDEVLKRSKSTIQWEVKNPFKNISSPGFVIYQFSEGKPIDQVEDENKRTFIKGEIGLELLRQILVEGTYQADPNIGNFKVIESDSSKKPIQVDWLDLDHVGHLTNLEKSKLRGLVEELLFRKDIVQIADCLASSVQEETTINKETLQESIKIWLEETKALSSLSISAIEDLFIAFLDFLGKNKLLLKENYVVLLKSLGLMKPFLNEIPIEKLFLFFSGVHDCHHSDHGSEL